MKDISNFYLKERNKIKENKEIIHYVNIYVENNQNQVIKSSEKWSDNLVNNMEKIYNRKIDEEKKLEKKSMMRRFLESLKMKASQLFYKVLDFFGGMLDTIGSVFLGLYDIVSSAATKLFDKITDLLEPLNPLNLLSKAKNSIFALLGGGLAFGKGYILQVLGSFSIGYLIGTAVNGILNYGVSHLAGKKTTLGAFIHEILHGTKEANESARMERQKTISSAFKSNRDKAQEQFDKMQNSTKRLDEIKNELTKLRTKDYQSGKFTNEEITEIENELLEEQKNVKKMQENAELELMKMGLGYRKEQGEDVRQVVIDIGKKQKLGRIGTFIKPLGKIIDSSKMSETYKNYSILNQALVDIGENAIKPEDINFKSDIDFKMKEFILEGFIDTEKGTVLGFDVGLTEDNVFNAMKDGTKNLYKKAKNVMGGSGDVTNVSGNVSTGSTNLNVENNGSFGQIASLNIAMGNVNNNININDNKSLRTILIDETKKMEHDIEVLKNLKPNIQISENINNYGMERISGFNETQDIRDLMNKSELTINAKNIMEIGNAGNEILFNYLNSFTSGIPIRQPVDTYV